MTKREIVRNGSKLLNLIFNNISEEEFVKVFSGKKNPMEIIKNLPRDADIEMLEEGLKGVNEGRVPKLDDQIERLEKTLFEFVENAGYFEIRDILNIEGIEDYARLSIHHSDGEINYNIVMHAYYSDMLDDIIKEAEDAGIKDPSQDDFEISINGVVCSLYCLDPEKYIKISKKVGKIERKYDRSISNL